VPGAEEEVLPPLAVLPAPGVVEELPALAVLPPPLVAPPLAPLPAPGVVAELPVLAEPPPAGVAELLVLAELPPAAEEDAVLPPFAVAEFPPSASDEPPPLASDVLPPLEDVLLLFVEEFPPLELLLVVPVLPPVAVEEDETLSPDDVEDGAPAWPLQARRAITADNVTLEIARRRIVHSSRSVNPDWRNRSRPVLSTRPERSSSRGRPLACKVRTQRQVDRYSNGLRPRPTLPHR
jgi:hypothetical protein